MIVGNPISHSIKAFSVLSRMGYSRDYLKLWADKKRKRDHEEFTDSSPDFEELPPPSLHHPHPMLSHVQGGNLTTDSSTPVNHHVSDSTVRHDSPISDVNHDSQSINTQDSEEQMREDDDSDGDSEIYACIDNNHDDHDDLDDDNGSSVSSTASKDSTENNLTLNQAARMGDNIMLMEEHCSEEFSTSPAESCSFELMRMLDKAGSPRYLYDDVRALLNNFFHNGGLQETKEMMSRETLMKSLYEKFHYPQVQTRQIASYHVHKFPFVDMLQDLVDSCGNDIHIIDIPNTAATAEQNDNLTTKSELWNTSWMVNTFRNCRTYHDFDSKTQIMLPLIIYMDKTGTDALQRYSLEPVLFTTAAIPRVKRESERSWRHLGFIPPFGSNKGNDQSSHTYEDKQLPVYHEFLGFLLEDLIHAQKHPPVVTITRNKEKKQVLARLPVMLVMGDQKSQDTLCGRKQANSGGAGRVHRSCMCSYLTVDHPNHSCIDVCSQTINKLNDYALTSSTDIDEISSQYSDTDDDDEKSVIKNYLERQKKINAQILQYPFTQHPIRNAFRSVDFGSWESGIFTAAFDDFMHSTESGIFEYTGELAYGGLTKTEKQDFEAAVQSIFDRPRSSARSSCPRWRIGENFTNQTRMTCAEKVGGIFLLALASQYPEMASILHEGHSRQREKYVTFWHPPKKDSSETSQKKKETSKKKKIVVSTEEEFEENNKKMKEQTPCYWERHMPPKEMSPLKIERCLVALARHGFDIQILESLDILQIYSLISHCETMDQCRYPASYPKKNIPEYYEDLGKSYKVPENIKKRSLEAFSSKRNDTVRNSNPNIHLHVNGTIPKHYRRKTKKNGTGSTSAILTENMRSFGFFMEYLLCFHAFCKYSSTLSREVQENIDRIEFGCRTTVQYFEKTLYRGDDTLDSRTTKVHANKRVGLNHSRLGTLMHADCQTGERLLKTKAKSISATAQQRGNSIFEGQSMHRIQEDTVLSQYERHLVEKKMYSTSSKKSTRKTLTQGTVNVCRRQPNFRYDHANRRWLELDRKGKIMHQQEQAYIDPAITDAFLQLEPDLDVHEIYSEIQLVDGSRVRASPNFSKSGPWYDYVNVKWQLDGQTETSTYPARCLAFYKKPGEKPGESDDDGTVEEEQQERRTQTSQLMALLHGTTDPPKPRTGIFLDTLLTSNYVHEYTETNGPKIYSLSVECIEYSVLCFPHQPRSGNPPRLFDYRNTGIKMVRSRNDWAYTWVAWNDILQQSNSPAAVKRRQNTLVDLGSDHVINKVHKRAEEYLRIEETDKRKPTKE